LSLASDLLIGGPVTSVTHSAGAAQIAASIEYETITRPADLPDDMQPLPGASLRFLSIKAIDGFKVQAALWQPEDKSPTDTTMIVGVHGSGGNLASLPLRAIARGLSARGYAALSVSTRQHDEHVNTDNFFDVRRDIEAALATVKALGYRSIALHGHSLGTVQVEFYAATDWDPRPTELSCPSNRSCCSAPLMRRDRSCRTSVHQAGKGIYSLTIQRGWSTRCRLGSRSSICDAASRCRGPSPLDALRVRPRFSICALAAPSFTA
jgi:hypothetical protein